MLSLEVSPSFTPEMLTQPFGPTTSFTKYATSLIIGPQPALVPADRAVFEGDLELAVVVHPRHEFLGEPGTRSR